jgi:hypothetical protein
VSAEIEMPDSHEEVNDAQLVLYPVGDQVSKGQWSARRMEAVRAAVAAVGRGRAGAGRRVDQTLRSLTTSPISTARSIKRIAWRDAAWKPVGLRRRTRRPRVTSCWPDIDPVEVAMAVQEKLRGGGGSAHERENGAHSVLTMGPDGSVIVPADYVTRLGNGMVDRGRGVLDRIIGEIRARRVR